MTVNLSVKQVLVFCSDNATAWLAALLKDSVGRRDERKLLNISWAMMKPILDNTVYQQPNNSLTKLDFPRCLQTLSKQTK